MRKAGERPVNGSGDHLSQDQTEAKGRPADRLAEKISALPECSIPGGAIVKPVVKVDEERSARLQFRNARTESAECVRNVVQHSERVSEVCRCIGQRDCVY